MSPKEFVGTNKGLIYNEENRENDSPQESPSSGWLVTIFDKPAHVKKKFATHKFGEEGDIWVKDPTFSVQVIE